MNKRNGIGSTTRRKAARWTALAGLALAGVTSAATMESPPVHVGTFDQGECTAANIGPTAIASVTVDLMDSYGGVLSTNTCNSLPYNAPCYVFAPGPFYMRCRVTIAGGSPKRVRALMDVRDSNNNERLAIEAR